MFSGSETRVTFRWYSSWALIAAFLPIILVYLILISYSLKGYATGNIAVFQNPVGSNNLLHIHALSDGNGRHVAIRQIESDIHSSFSVSQDEFLDTHDVDSAY